MAGNVVADLIRSLLDNLQESGSDLTSWEALSMILEFPEGSFNEAHGYLYLPDGEIAPVAADPWKVESAVKAYTDSYYAPGDTLPRKILVQFDRASGKYNVLFEETDEDRWKVTPRNFREIREELRPALA